MPSEKPLSNAERDARLLAEIRRDQAIREKGYREQALKLFPHLCARCGREFSGKRLRELTVHHKDNNHHNNPVDGSNWELLCLYCHDHEHEKSVVGGYYQGPVPEDKPPPLTANPFGALDQLVKPDRKDG